jgi:hypothetical protein
MPPAHKPYREYKRDWPPKLITRLRSTYATQVETSAQHVSVLIHEARCPYNDDTYKILGVFKSSFIANRLALDFFKKEYSQYLDTGDNWSDFVEGDSPDDNGVAWRVSESGELSLIADDAGDGDKYKVYVERQVVHTSYQPSIIESAEGYDWSPQEAEDVSRLIAGSF